MAQRPLLPPLQLAAPGSAGAPPLASDLLRGADEIRDYLRLKSAKQVYRLVDANRKRPGSAPPILRDGTGFVARKSALDAWYARAELASQKQPG